MRALVVVGTILMAILTMGAVVLGISQSWYTGAIIGVGALGTILTLVIRYSDACEYYCDCDCCRDDDNNSTPSAT